MAARKEPARARRRSRPAPGRGRFVRLATRTLAWSLAIATSALIALQFWYLGHVLWWTRVDPGSSAFMRAQAEILRREEPRIEIAHQWVGYPRISSALKQAVIASEDAHFTEHDGVDWQAIESALERNVRKGRVVMGGSTITMQLAKNLFLSGERSYLRKAQELVITFMLEAVMSKRRILEIYLNIAEWGRGVFGAEAAARHYFGVSAGALDAAQAARLAAMLPRPRYYDAHRGSPMLARRAAVLRRWMNDVDPP